MNISLGERESKRKGKRERGGGWGEGVDASKQTTPCKEKEREGIGKQNLLFNVRVLSRGAAACCR